MTKPKYNDYKDIFLTKCQKESSTLKDIKSYYTRYKSVLTPIDGMVLCYAAKYGKIDMIEWAVSLGAKPNYFNDLALVWAVEQKQLEAVKYLMTFDGVTPGSRNNEAFDNACRRGMFEIVEEFLKVKDFHPEETDNHALRMASNNSHQKVIDILIADPRIMDKAIELNQTEFMPQGVKDVFLF